MGGFPDHVMPKIINNQSISCCKEVLLKERLSNVDLLVLISLHQLLLYLKKYFFFFMKHATLMRRPTVLSLPPWYTLLAVIENL
jgi:hypothetical protein